jgi:hypothetical protein
LALTVVELNEENPPVLFVYAAPPAPTTTVYEEPGVTETLFA